MYQFNFNNFTLQVDANHVIDMVDGLDGLDVRTSSDPLTGQDGGNIWAQNYAMRTITIGGSLFSTDFTSYYVLRDQLLNAFTIKVGRQLLTITRPDGVQKLIYAKVNGRVQLQETSGEVMEAKFQILLTCENPFLIDTVTQTGSALITSGSGTPILSVVPTPMIQMQGNEVIITNNGDVAGYANMTIYGNITNATVTKMQTGEHFTITDTLVDGETVNLYKNTQGLFVVNNLSGNAFSTFGGVFFTIEPGVNNIRFTAANSDSQALLKVTFNNLYLGM